MMEVYKIHITSWTASFRYPNLISGVQPTLEVPPVSTVLGLMNAAAGQYLEHHNLTIGYFFEYEAKGEDLETIYQYGGLKDGTKQFKKDPQGNFMVSNKNVTSNVILRHFLFNNHLYLYLTEESLANFFQKPYYQLVLGRSNDLATVERIEKVNLIPKTEATKIRGQVVPFGDYLLPGQIQALPKYFSNSITRNNLGTQPYSIINHRTAVEGNLKAFYDAENDVDIYFHQLNLFPR